MQLYFATGNSGKVRHARNILPEFKVIQLDVETVEPSNESIEEIARTKVEQVVEKTEIEEDTFLIADDSGIFVDSLNGFPGPQTAFFDNKVGKERILDLANEGDKAEFRSAIGLYMPENSKIKIFTGKAEGELVEPKGERGFGYDPVFLPNGNNKTWAEDPKFKDKNSHRQEAMEKMREYLVNIEL